jgi:hypothetical protein
VYKTESALVKAFLARLRGAGTPWGTVRVSQEFSFEGGRTDVVALCAKGKLIAFEAKLTKWKVALDQAYRNSFFADISYVVMPECGAEIAQRYSGEFARRGVGLCAVRSGRVVVVQQAEVKIPLQPWVRRAAATRITESNAGTRRSRNRGSRTLREA